MKLLIKMDIPEISLRINIANIRNISKFCSPEFIVRGMPWQIQVYKRKDAVLSVYLRCEEKNNSVMWSCMAQCKIKLISLCRQAFERSFKEPREFSASHRMYGYSNFISLKDVFDPKNSYVEDDTIILQIKVKANASINLTETLTNTELISDEMSKCFRLRIKSVSDLTGFYSPTVNIRGLPWRIKVYTTKIMNTKAISVMLNCVHAENSTNWSCKTRAVFRLIPFNESKAPLEWTFKTPYNFAPNSNSYGCKRFVSWKDLLDVNNSYMRNDSIVLEVELIVQKPVGIGSVESLTCPICLQNLNGRSISSTVCGHVYCKLCIEEAIEKRNFCPVCKRALELAQIHPIYLHLQ